MLELSPAYFEYMQSTFNKATSLIKIVGFYSGKLSPSPLRRPRARLNMMHSHNA